MAEVVLLQLFSGPDCHLCDQALDLISPQLREPYRLLQIDVTSSLALKKRYGLRIPVLRREDTDAELSWPFDTARLVEFLD